MSVNERMELFPVLVCTRLSPVCILQFGSALKFLIQRRVCHPDSLVCMGPDINMKDFKVLNLKTETISVFKVSDPTLISVRKALGVVFWGFFSERTATSPTWSLRGHQCLLINFVDKC